MRRSITLSACALLSALAALAALPPDSGADLVTELGPRHPVVLAGRLERVPADGSTLDVHRVLDAQEEALLAGYRGPEPFGPDPDVDPQPRSGAYLDLHARTFPWGPRRRPDRR